MTQKLYYTDIYSQEFCGRVLESRREGKRMAVLLDQTLFYPESGGQPSDRGALHSYPIIDVKEDEEDIFHYVPAGSEIESGQEICGRIDWPRRFDHMQQHTGQHILSQAFLRTLGAPTESFHMGSDYATIDLAVESLSPEQIYEAEDLANQIIFENRSIYIRFARKEEVTLRKPTAREGEVRVIEIEDFDRSACGGTHCSRTGEVGLVKVRRWERVRGQARVDFVCGSRALADYRHKNRHLYQIAQLFSTGTEETLRAITSLREKDKTLRKEIKRLEEELVEAEADRLADSALDQASIRLLVRIFESWSADRLNRLAGFCLDREPKAVLILATRSPRPFILMARSSGLEIDLRPVFVEVLKSVNGKGGGSAERVQGGVGDSGKIEEAVNQAKAELREKFSSEE